MDLDDFDAKAGSSLSPPPTPPPKRNGGLAWVGTAADGGVTDEIPRATDPLTPTSWVMELSEVRSVADEAWKSCLELTGPRPVVSCLDDDPFAEGLQPLHEELKHARDTVRSERYRIKNHASRLKLLINNPTKQRPTSPEDAYQRWYMQCVMMGISIAHSDVLCSILALIRISTHYTVLKTPTAW